MSYAVKELYYTLQGEGMQAGRPAVFCRFAGCNLWTGREQDRHRATCRFCDTDFVGTDGPGGGKFAAADDLARAALALWPAEGGARYIVCTGGEPALQLDAALVNALHGRGFEVAIETNGTTALASGIDWICMSPKAGTTIVVREGDELKLVYPQPDAPPDAFEDLGFRHFLLQPMDGPDRERNTRLAMEYCLAHPGWRLSLQTHKYLGIP
jgi:7-carboxy-7-deazaguanine synthase (Cx14CxxC type)